MAAAPIVVGIDSSEEALRAVDWAAREAVLRGSPLRIVSAAAMPPRMGDRRSHPGPATVADTLVDERDRALAAAAERASAVAPDLLVDVDGLGGSPARAITEAGSGASMLVVGCRGMGAFTALILGSVSRYAAAHAPCPVVVVREETSAALRQVGVGIKDPAGGSAALAFAFEEASLRKARLIAVHASDSPHGDVARARKALAAPAAHALEEEAAGQLQTLLADWQGRYPDVEVSHDFVYAHPGRALVGLSARADLVVVGRHREDGALPGPGAVRHAVLNHAHGPVVTVPSS
jgi:nucleotide-binding universal stress UspA family protein